MAKQFPKLPKDWSWSYILRPDKNSTKRAHVTFWSACAVRFLGKQKTGTRMDYSLNKAGTPINVELGLYNEVYAQGKTMKEATAKLIEIITTRKHFKRRWIHFPDED